MNDRDEAWFDSLLQRQGLPGPSDEGFSRRVLLRLPVRERRGRRALVLGLTVVGAAGALLLPGVWGAGVMASAHTDGLIIPCSLGAAGLWYVVDLLT